MLQATLDKAFRLLILLVLGLALPALAGDKDEATADAENGARLYRTYCQNCHGPDGKGDGPIATILLVAPADLTAIARHNDGEFPANDVYLKIDGRTEIAAHGSREMPIWGYSFQDAGRDTDQEDEVHGRIRDLVAFVASIQEGAD